MVSCCYLSAPPIILAAVVGLVIAFVQAATQLQEQTLQYVAKFFAVVLTIFVTASMLGCGAVPVHRQRLLEPGHVGAALTRCA